MNLSYWKDRVSNKTVLDWIQNGVPVDLQNNIQPFVHNNRKFNKVEADFLDKEISRLIKLKYIKEQFGLYIADQCNTQA